MSGHQTTAGPGVYSGKIKEEEIKITDFLPKEKYCPNESCFSSGVKKDFNEEFCSRCGEKLETRIGDIYVDLHFGDGGYDRINRRLQEVEGKLDPSRGVPDYPEPIKEDTLYRSHLRVSMKDLVRILKKYEEEVFVEDI